MFIFSCLAVIYISMFDGDWINVSSKITNISYWINCQSLVKIHCQFCSPVSLGCLLITLFSISQLNAHCCNMGSAIKHLVPDRVKPSFVIFDIRASDAQGWASEWPDVKNYKWRLNPVWHRMLCSWIHLSNVGVRGLKCTSGLTSCCLVRMWVYVINFFHEHHLWNKLTESHHFVRQS